ncbi:MAG: bifunctional glutamate N-acetyltransferase/amino-acid acetyltransferase ArgJ [Chromatiales bacterium]|nr:bifunctional glutamate N-acetyltransferase/amino-acid acetyltransferase ArgJ [Chromatiales bacterium]
MEKQNKPIPIKGISIATAACGIRYRGRDDLVLMELSEQTTTAACFTRNALKGAPVILAEQHLRTTQPRYLLINAGNANVGLGLAGIADAEACCVKVADLAGVDTQQVLPFSTGLISERLPLSKMISAIPYLFEDLTSDHWLTAAQAIMTTDTIAKWFSVKVPLGSEKISITGIAKGSGMICPNMATMLAYIATDIKIDQQTTQQLLSDAVAISFNCITVDGDTSTNDACVLLASGASEIDWDLLSANQRATFIEALQTVMQELAKMIIRDAEGAGHFIEIRVEQACSYEEAKQVAYTIAHSPLVKTAFAAADPNWGRIIAAIGRSGLEELDMNKVSCFIGSHRLYHCGAVDPNYDEEVVKTAMMQTEVGLRVLLGRGTERACLWTSDLTEDYVRINAGYRS